MKDASSSRHQNINQFIGLRNGGGGIGIFINDHVSLDIGMGYASVSSKWLDSNTNRK